jgi:hypothetical protein
LLGGGAQDGGWDRSGMGRVRLAIIPNETHYDVVASPAVSAVVVPFLDGYSEQPAAQ